MFFGITYLVSIFLFYSIFFNIRHFSREKVYLDDNDKSYYRRYEYHWIDKGKYKLPVWLWLLGLIILAIPVLNIVVYVFFVIAVVTGGGNSSDDRYVLWNGFTEFLKKKY